MNYWFLVLKIIIIYFTLIILLRILGKREVGELSIFDLVVLLIIADIASLGVDNDEFFFPSFICLGILVILQKALSFFLLNNSKYRSWIDGNPTVIVRDGKLLVKNMKKEHYTIDDLISQMRLEHIMDISEIKLAILETNGILSVFRTSQFEELRLPVISSGNLIMDSIISLQLNSSDIDVILRENKLDINKILYASYGNSGFYYFYRNDRKEEVLECRKLKIK